MKQILLTGSSGFIGKHFRQYLQDNQYPVRCTTRNNNLKHSTNDYYIGNIDGETNWSHALENIDVVVHCAARAHIMSDDAVDPLNEYRSTNVNGTLNLARQAANLGVKRFILISSIKVCGETTTGVAPFTECSLSTYMDPYALSKKEAEDALISVASDSKMEFVIIRPPLVYGPGVKANFHRLIKLADSFIPLPFGMINNRRSMIYVGNLSHFSMKCIDHPSAANETFLISDGADLSLSDLLNMIKRSLGRWPLLLPVPSVFLRFLGYLMKKNDLLERLVGDMQLDTSKAVNMLGWNAPYTVEQGINASVLDYCKNNNNND